MTATSYSPTAGEIVRAIRRHDGTEVVGRVTAISHREVILFDSLTREESIANRGDVLEVLVPASLDAAHVRGEHDEEAVLGCPVCEDLAALDPTD